MIITSHLFCPHGLLKPDYWDFRNENEVYTIINLLEFKY